MIVFLDFDGVTHGVSGPIFDEDCLTRLDEVFTEHAARVVIISSWRDELPMEQLVTRLRHVGRHVIGIAPEEPACTKTPRELVVEQWLAENQYEGPWLAIDDNPRWYGTLMKRVVAPNSQRGFGRDDVQRFRDLAARVTTGETEESISRD